MKENSCNYFLKLSFIFIMDKEKTTCYKTIILGKVVTYKGGLGGLASGPSTEVVG